MINENATQDITLQEYERIEADLLKLIKDMPKGSRAIDCPFQGCGRSYLNKFSLLRHYPIHNPAKQHRCEFCGKEFTLIQYLRDHLNLHTGNKPYKCDVAGCDEAFTQSGRLSHHKRRVHGLTGTRRRPRRIQGQDDAAANKTRSSPTGPSQASSKQQPSKPPADQKTAHPAESTAANMSMAEAREDVQYAFPSQTWWHPNNSRYQQCSESPLLPLLDEVRQRADSARVVRDYGRADVTGATMMPRFGQNNPQPSQQSSHQPSAESAACLKLIGQKRPSLFQTLLTDKSREFPQQRGDAQNSALERVASLEDPADLTSGQPTAKRRCIRVQDSRIGTYGTSRTKFEWFKHKLEKLSEALQVAKDASRTEGLRLPLPESFAEGSGEAKVSTYRIDTISKGEEGKGLNADLIRFLSLPN